MTNDDVLPVKRSDRRPHGAGWRVLACSACISRMKQGGFYPDSFFSLLTPPINDWLRLGWEDLGTPLPFPPTMTSTNKWSPKGMAWDTILHGTPPPPDPTKRLLPHQLVTVGEIQVVACVAAEYIAVCMSRFGWFLPLPRSLRPFPGAGSRSAPPQPCTLIMPVLWGRHQRHQFLSESCP